MPIAVKKEEKIKLLIFDVWSDYAHYKKAEATTSPLTHTIPTGTALKGLIAAILGFKRDSYYLRFEEARMRFGVRILNPVKKITLNQNILNTKDGKGFFLWDRKENPRSPTPYQYLKDVKYRIYVSIESQEIYNKLKQLLKEHKCVYTPYLGISEMIANFCFVGETEVTVQEADETLIHSVINKDKAKINLKPREGIRWIIERIPLSMSEDRVVDEFIEVVFEANLNPLQITEGQYYNVDNDNIVLL